MAASGTRGSLWVVGTIGLVFALLLESSIVGAKETTHEDLRQVMLSLAHLVKESTDRLQSHDLRDRQMADQLKRTLAGIDRRLNSVEQPLRRLDDRLKTIEDVVGEVDKRGASQAEQQAGILSTLREMAFRPPPGDPEPAVVPVVPVGQALGMEVVESVRHLEVEVKNALQRLEARLAQQPQQAANTDEIKAILGGLIGEVKAIGATVDGQSGRHNQSLAGLSAVVETVNHFHAAADARAAQILAAITETMEDVEASINNVGSGAESRYAAVAASYDSLLQEVRALSGVEKILIQTGDNVLDAKRRVEYGVHQILMEVGSLITKQSSDLNETLNLRFDAISGDILTHQKENLGNLSSKIETEISQVWRQIGIMYEQLTASATMLDRLQQQTESYVNGSLSTMDSMAGKVSQITGRMGEVDENLNYLLGRLSLVTQEFNQIKSGLAGALDNIRKSFLELQGQVTDLGPGPNPIPDDGASTPAILPNRGVEVDNRV